MGLLGLIRGALIPQKILEATLYIQVGFFGSIPCSIQGSYLTNIESQGFFPLLAASYNNHGLLAEASNLQFFQNLRGTLGTIRRVTPFQLTTSFKTSGPGQAMLDTWTAFLAGAIKVVETIDLRAFGYSDSFDISVVIPVGNIKQVVVNDCNQVP